MALQPSGWTRVVRAARCAFLVRSTLHHTGIGRISKARHILDKPHPLRTDSFVGSHPGNDESAPSPQAGVIECREGTCVRVCAEGTNDDCPELGGPLGASNCGRGG